MAKQPQTNQSPNAGAIPETPNHAPAVSADGDRIQNRREAIAMAREVLRGPVSPDSRSKIEGIMRQLIDQSGKND